MKVLVAIEGKESPEILCKTTLRWAARAGFNMRIFVKPDQYEQYAEAIKDANYNHYLALSETALITNKTPKEFAKEEKFDLLLKIPDNLKKWISSKDLDMNVLLYAKEVGIARQEFSEDKTKKQYVFTNGAIMERL